MNKTMGRVKRRERMIEATIDLIRLEDMAAMTMDAICERAESRKGLHRYFKGKTSW